MSKIETIKVPFDGLPVSKVYIVQGDTIPPIKVTLSDDAPFTFTGATISMKLFKNDDLLFSAKTPDKGITITGERIAVIDEVPKEKNNFPEGILIGDFKIITADGKQKTYSRIQYEILRQYN